MTINITDGTPSTPNYWLVHGNGPADKKHGSFELAQAEALRLCDKHPGKVFAVLEVKSAYAGVAKTTALRVTPADQQPF